MSNRPIVAIDIADFTNPRRTFLHHKEMQEGLYRILEQAFDEAGIGWEACDTEDRGDGAIILAPSDCPRIALADRLTNRLVAGLLRYNESHSESASMQLRVALHAGDVYLTPNGKVSPAINLIARLLNAEFAKLRLRETHGLLAVIASDHFFQDTIVGDPVAEPSFERIPVIEKRTNVVAWLRLFGVDDRARRETQVLGLLPESELLRLRHLIERIDTELADLPLLVGRATGFGVPPGERLSGVWNAVRFLLDRNAGPEGFPPLLTFVELLAEKQDAALGGYLRDWNDSQARRMGLVTGLRDLRIARSSATEESQLLHLVVLIEHDGLDPDRYLVSHWRQDDPAEWPPARGETREAHLSELEDAIDDLVVGAEIAWAGCQSEVALEFVLPRALLNLPVEQWRKEHKTTNPSLLALEYPVVVRSLERMRSAQWHRVWKNRWHQLHEAPWQAGVFFADAADVEQPYRIDIDLGNPQMAAMILSEPPSREPRRGDELTAALRYGLPAVLWTRMAGSLNALRTTVGHLLRHGGVHGLPDTLTSARRNALGGVADHEIDQEIIRNLVLMWDDPNRLVILDRP
jgi:hypothetical protein